MECLLAAVIAQAHTAAIVVDIGATLRIERVLWDSHLTLLHDLCDVFDSGVEVR